MEKEKDLLKSFHTNGNENEQIWCEVNYINDKINGVYKEYHANGQLRHEVNYINGIKQQKVK